MHKDIIISMQAYILLNIKKESKLQVETGFPELEYLSFEQKLTIVLLKSWARQSRTQQHTDPGTSHTFWIWTEKTEPWTLNTVGLWMLWMIHNKQPLSQYLVSQLQLTTFASNMNKHRSKIFQGLFSHCMQRPESPFDIEVI